MSENKNQYTFKLSVYLRRRANLRNRDRLVYIGFSFLRDLFDTDKDLSETKILELEHPERWCNVLELRVLFDAIANKCPNLKELTVYTSNEHLVAVTPNDCIFITEEEKDEMIKYNNGKTYKPGVRWSCLPENEKDSPISGYESMLIPIISTYAEESKVILEDVLGVTSRPLVKKTKLLNDYLSRINKGDIDSLEVNNTRLELEQFFGSDYSKLKLADMVIKKWKSKRDSTNVN